MKKLLVTLLFPVTCFSQHIPDTCFTQQEMQDILFTIDSLYELDDINKQIIAKQDEYAQQLNLVVKLDSIQLSYQTEQTKLLKSNIDLYVEREKRLEPKWYDNKIIWFGSGILSTIFTGAIISEYFK